MTAERELQLSISSKLKLKSITIGIFHINYVEIGSGPALLLIHGINIGWGQWYPNLVALSKCFTVYAIDLPGAGGSSKINFTKSSLEGDFVDTVEGFIKKMGLKKVSIVGHSLGGWVALKLALREGNRLDKLVLINSMGFSDRIPLIYKMISFLPFARLISHTVMWPSRKNLKKFLVSVLHRKNKINEVFVDYYFEGVHRGGYSHPLMLIQRLSSFYKMSESLILTNELSKIQNQTLIIVGEKDPLIPAEHVQKKYKIIPNVQLEVIKDVGHVVSLEDSGIFNELVLRFLGCHKVTV